MVINRVRKPQSLAKIKNVKETLISSHIEYFLIDCPWGWFFYADYCYTLSPIMEDNDHSIYWSIPYQYCGLGRLSITSRHEQAFVLAIVAFIQTYMSVSEDVWIGLHQENENGFEWLNEDALR